MSLRARSTAYAQSGVARQTLKQKESANWSADDNVVTRGSQRPHPASP